MPVFLPFAGCPHRCLFCDQCAQTGQKVRSLSDVLHDLEQELALLEAQNAPPREIAFYGGTFTALPRPERFLELAVRYRKRGLITRIRCSTRPDSVTAQSLDYLKQLGLDMVELGVQSFDDHVLAASLRGYTGSIARRGCELVQRSGMELTIQLLPGLPGGSEDVFIEDCRTVAELGPDAARFYPCLVVEGTRLAEQWRAGLYAPWSLERTVDELARGLGILWQAGVGVIRMGVAQEPGMRVLAGPEHPALGQMARSLALFEHIRAKVESMTESMNMRPTVLRYPAKYSGEIMGHKGELAPAYAALGLEQVSGWDAAQFSLI